MESINIPEGVGLAGVLAILIRNHWPVLKTFFVAILGKAVPSMAADKTVSDVGCVVAYNTIRQRLSSDTAEAVWCEIQPGRVIENESPKGGT